MSRSNLENNRMTAVHFARGSFGWVRRIVTASFTLNPITDPPIQFYDGGNQDRIINLPQIPDFEGRVYMISNVGASNNLDVRNTLNQSLGLVGPGSGGIFVGTPQEWHLLGEVGGTAIQGIVSSDNSITPSIVGANWNLVVNPAHVDHDLLLHWVANKHIDHSAVLINAGTGMNGGGDITASRTLTFDPTNATTLAPVLGDTFAFFSASAAGVRKNTFTGLNAIIDHNQLLNFVANKHIDHSLVTISGGQGLSAGGDITASRTISYNFPGLFVSTSPSLSDSLIFYSVANNDHERMTLTTLGLALGAGLTRVNDTNVTLTLGGTPASALLQATSLTLGWTGALAEGRGGTNQTTYALGDTLYASATNTLSKLAGNTTANRKYKRQTGTGTVSAAPVWETIFASPITPTALAADVNDYNPTGLAGANRIRQDGGVADRNITGLTAQTDGSLYVIQNIGTTNALILKNQSGSSSAANRFLLNNDITLAPNQAAMLCYDGTASRWMCTAVYTSSSGGVSDIAVAGDNIIMNGGMEVSQINGASAVSIVNTSNYVLDQWPVFSITSSTLALSVQQVTPPGSPAFGGAFPSALQAKATAAQASFGATDRGAFFQNIEGTRLARLGFGAAGAQSVTIGFWVYATIAGTITVVVQNAASTRTYLANVTINNATTWEWHTVTIPGDTTGTWPTTTAVAAFLMFGFGSGVTFQGTNNSWNAGNFTATSTTTNFYATINNVVAITGVVMLAGSHTITQAQAPNLIRPFSAELSLCQRYYELSGPGIVRANGSNTGSQQYWVSWSVTKRVAPTVAVFTAPTYSNGSGFTVFNPSATGFESFFSASASGGFATGWVVSGDARM